MPDSPRAVAPVGMPFVWKQGEHMAVVGDTGTGKTTLMARLIPARANYIVLQTKSDPKAQWDGKVVRHDSDIERYPQNHHFLLRPKYEEQRRETARMLERSWKEQGWTVVLDELFYVYDFLGVKAPINRNLTQGRSMGITMVSGLQRPVAVTRFALSQSTHVIAFRQDGRDAVTLAEVVASRELAKEYATLQPYEFLWFHRPTRRAWRGSLSRDGKRLIPSGSSKAETAPSERALALPH